LKYSNFCRQEGHKEGKRGIKRRIGERKGTKRSSSLEKREKGEASGERGRKGTRRAFFWRGGKIGKWGGVATGCDSKKEGEI